MFQSFTSNITVLRV